MATPSDADAEDAFQTINRVVEALRTAGVGEEAIAPTMIGMSIFLWRNAGWTDDEIAAEFAGALAIPLGRNPRPARGS